MSTKSSHFAASCIASKAAAAARAETMAAYGEPEIKAFAAASLRGAKAGSRPGFEAFMQQFHKTARNGPKTA